MNLLRKLPKVDKLVRNPIFKGLNSSRIAKITKAKLASLRENILLKKIDDFNDDELLKEIKYDYEKLFTPSLKPLINATGVILHTNMGRSLISEHILCKSSKIITNYSNLEYNQKNGRRGDRYMHVRKQLKHLLHVEDVLIVNNNASAVFLILNTFSKNKEAIVSRGELVEIGGSFRIPDVMRQSGAILKEVGTTNKTKKEDYQNAINENSAMLMKVHQSNFSIQGFTEETKFQTIKKLSADNDLIDYYDLGSGYIPELPYNLGKNETTLDTLLKEEPSLVSFSGDKLFGSVQAGVILGKKKLIDRLKKNQLLRMLRVDKITLSILEETINAYLKEDYESIPTLWMLFQSEDALYQRVLDIKKTLSESTCSVVRSETFVGGGSLPNKKFPTVCLHVEGDANKLEKKFRRQNIIGRIENDMFFLDFRSILPQFESQITDTINTITEEINQ